MFKGIMISSLALCAMLASTPVPSPETDTRPTQADERFKAKYGIWPPHITAEKRAEQERARSVKQKNQTKEKASKAQSERSRN